MAEKQVSVRLTARIDQYQRAMKEAKKSTDLLAKDGSTNFTALGTQMTSLGSTMTRRVSLPLAALAVGAGKAAVDWGSAWAGVTKTVDGTAGQLERLEGDLRAMAQELPATHGEIAAVAEAAGQLGVGVDDVAEFTEVMIDLGETTNLTADQAATSLARFSNIMGTPTSDVRQLADVIVELGNNSATTEAEIVEMGTRLAAAGKIAGLSEADVFAFASTLTSVGVEAEAGGTALSKVFTSIRDSVLDGGEKLEVFASVAGTTAADFAAQFNNDPAMAISSFVEGLGRMNDAGESTTGVFDDLELTDQRLMRALLSTGEAGDLLATQLGLASKAAEEGGASSEEAAKRYETTGAKIEMLRNKFVDLGISVGTILLPAIEGFVGFAGGMIDFFEQLPAPVQTAIGVLAGVALVLGPMLVMVGSLIRAWGSLKLAMSAVTLSNPAMLALTGIAVGAAAAIAIFSGNTKSAEANVRDLSASVTEAQDPVRLFGEYVAETAANNEILLAAMNGAGVTVDEYTQAAIAAEQVSREHGKSVGALKASLDELSPSEAAAISQFIKMGTAIHDAHLSTLDANASMNERYLASEALNEITGPMNQELSETVSKMELLEGAGITAAESTDELTGSTENLTDAEVAQQEEATQLAADALALASALGQAEDDTVSMTGATEALDSAISELSSQMDDLIGTTISTQRAEDEWIATLQDMRSAVDDAKNGVEGASLSLDAFTEEGRTNREMLRGAAEDVLAMGVGLLESGESANTARGRMLDMRNELINSAAQFTGTRAEAVAYVDALGLTPTNINTAITLSGVAEVEATLATLTQDRNATIYMNQVVGTVVRTPDQQRQGGGSTERDGGGFGRPGDLVAERRPEFVGGALFTQPTIMATSAHVTSGAQTEAKFDRLIGLLEGAGGRGVNFNGDIVVRDQTTVDMVFDRADAAIGVA